MQRLSVLSLLLALAAPPAPAANLPGAPATGPGSAGEFVCQAFEAAGGADAAGLLDRFILEAHGVSYGIGQAMAPEQPPPALPAERFFHLDRNAQRVLFEGQDQALGGYVYRYRVVVSGRAGHTLDLTRNSVRGNAVRALPDRAQQWWRASLRAHLPILLLEDACQGAERVKWPAAASADGLPRVVWDSPGMGPMRIVFGKGRPAQVVALESEMRDPALGLVTRLHRYKQSRPFSLVERLRLPAGWQVWMGPQLAEDFDVTSMRAVESLPESRFAVPSGYDDNVDWKLPVKVTELGRGVHLVSGLGGAFRRYQSLAVEFADQVVMVEAPLDTATARQALDAIAKAIPGKPVKSLVVTHHHIDHAGGVRALIDAGATVFASPGDRAFLEQLRERDGAHAGDKLDLKSKKLDLRLVDDRAVLEDGTQRLEILAFRGSGHAEHMLYAWLPKSGIVFQADLLVAPEWGPLPPLIDVNRRFFRALDQRGIRPSMIAGVHGRPVTGEELWALVPPWRDLKK